MPIMSSIIAQCSLSRRTQKVSRPEEKVMVSSENMRRKMAEASVGAKTALEMIQDNKIRYAKVRDNVRRTLQEVTRKDSLKDAASTDATQIAV